MFGIRRLLTVFTLLCVVSPAFGADTPAEPSTYGKALSDAELTPISELLASPEDFVGKTVKVEGRILGVCEMRGCWIEIASDEEFESIRFKVEDGEMVFPVEAKGRLATAEGTFEKIELDLDQTRKMKQHECEEKGEPFDPETVTEAAVIYRIAGQGAVVR